MAQWLGQYSGHTHGTAIEDAEALLRHAITVFRAAATEAERRRKAKSVRKLAKRVLSVRLRHMKSHLVNADRHAPPSPLRLREEALREQGVPGILAEFGAPDAAGESSE